MTAWLPYALGAAAVGLLLSKSQTPPPGLARSQPCISSLTPGLQPLAVEFVWRAWRAGIPVVLTDCLRDELEQELLYQQGRTTTGPIVTNAKPGASQHNYGRAFDVAILDARGNPTWPEAAPVWDELGRIGKALGLDPGARFGDRPHFQWSPP